jgi:GDPmannose 4,6-dehydratase
LRALISGVTGQDGSYLAELLLSKGYEVHGIVRRSSNINTNRIDHLYESPQNTNRKLILHYGDLTDGSRLVSLIAEIKPDEIYNLGAQSHVKVSFDEPEFTGEVTGLGTSRILEAIKTVSPQSKFYQASSSEMFGATPPPQNEETVFYPRSPYGAAKLYSYWMTRNYREAYGLFAVNGILFNHESPRRGETFLTRKVSLAAARIKLGIQDKLFLGNLEAIRDWGYAPEYVNAMWLMLQQDVPEDFVIATGSAITVRDFVEHAFAELDLDWTKYVEFDERYLRPTEVDSLIGDSSKASARLGWKAATTPVELAGLMTRYDLDRLKSGNPRYIDVPRFG